MEHGFRNDCSCQDADYQRDLAIKVMDYIWYEYLGMKDEVQEYDFALQDTIHEIVRQHHIPEGADMLNGA
jgi:hypothetical protein